MCPPDCIVKSKTCDSTEWVEVPLSMGSVVVIPADLWILNRDTDCARFLLSRLLGDVILRPDKQGLVAEVRAICACY